MPKHVLFTKDHNCTTEYQKSFNWSQNNNTMIQVTSIVLMHVYINPIVQKVKDTYSLKELIKAQLIFEVRMVQTKSERDLND